LRRLRQNGIRKTRILLMEKQQIFKRALLHLNIIRGLFLGISVFVAIIYSATLRLSWIHGMAFIGTCLILYMVYEGEKWGKLLIQFLLAGLMIFIGVKIFNLIQVEQWESISTFVILLAYLGYSMWFFSSQLFENYMGLVADGFKVERE